MDDESAPQLETFESDSPLADLSSSKWISLMMIVDDECTSGTIKSRIIAS